MAVKNRKSKKPHDNNETVDNAHDSINESVQAIEKQLDEIKTSTSSTNLQKNKNLESSHKKKLKDSRRVIFILGALLGVIIAVYFGTNNKVSDLDQLMNFTSLNDYFDDWKDVVPTGLQGILNDIQNKPPGQGQDFSESFAVGKALRAEENLTSKHSVIMVPGVISTGIESWGLDGVDGCRSQQHFRKRLWGSMYMLRMMFLDKTCWLKHIMLDPETGLDPPGVKLRAAQGFEAADFFIVGYWIWNKILENLSAIGYEPNRMATASYDWRLSYLDLERRDGYFSKLKDQVEFHYRLTGEKSVLVGHSMGSQVIYYFMKWVEAEGIHFGNGGPDWINKYIDSYVDISGSMLGAPKAVPALISGEMKDTVQLNALAVYGLEKFFSRRERLDMLRTFGGIASMLPKGGDLIWGNLENGSFEDRLHPNNTETFANFIRFDEEIGQYSSKNLTVADSIEFVLQNSPSWFERRTKEHYSYGVAKSARELQENNQNYPTWSNPLEAPLPNAPDLKVYCFYGVGNPTERAYIYQEEQNKDISKLNISISSPSDTKKSTVFFTDGDGTIPLITHSMCHKWKTSKAYNPGGAQVKVVEIQHDPDRFDIRGGAKTAEHVDILGSAELNELILKVAAGSDHLINERIITDLPKWVADMNFGFD
ncbi:hypothetical protein WICMUC_003700 [Wickerhamomyces mucosus]|uniref:Phospholipid:diacylglycerol acyltransferase n=1 Tax=Wickerhamomyces mucosus TaxID=1378264 RepID=A0A9P8TCD8_9ASCO|nr:hypothetical protein WICMUC_003700 [Wickerhamomyces mucosus]